MHHILFESCTQYQIAVLAKTDALRKDDISQWYIDPLVAAGIPQRSFIAFSLEYGTAKKPSVAYIKEYLQDELLPELNALGVKYLYCTDGNYFKVLTKQQKAEVHLGYVLPCAIPGYEHMQVILSMNYKAVFANDAVKDKIIRANEALVAHYTNTYTAPGTNIIHSAKYIESDATKIKAALEPLLLFPSLTADTETFSLRHTKAKLGTISFAWDEHNGIAIDILHKEATIGFPEWKTKHKAILEALRWFFETYEGTVIWHNATYDIKILVYLLYMENLTDTAGLLHGLEVMTKNFEDTKVIAYLATNTCSENPLDLKSLAQPFAGNYAQEDIKDIVLIPSAKLLEYNLIDCLSTWYVLNKYHPLMVSANQEGIYKTLFKPMLKQAIQMELTGMPINMANVIKADKELEQVIQTNYDILNQSTILQAFIYEMREQELIRRNAAYKKKVITIEDVKYEFNPNSNDQVGALLHEFLGFEVFAYTPTKKPVVGADELKGHLNRTSDPNVKVLIQAIMDILEGVKIRNTFIAKFLEADEYDGWHYLFGGFNVGGTKSGRLSSSDPVSLFD